VVIVTHDMRLKDYADQMFKINDGVLSAETL
ncbi:ABC transporter ATP-binding protein, partial [Enterococcus faecalis]